MENLGLDRRKAIEELIRGHDFASQLRELINKSSNESGRGGDDSAVTIAFAEDLLGKVLRSFTNTLLLLNNKINESEEASQLQIRDSSSWKPTKSEDSQESCKSSSIIKERRGSYKRSKRTSQTWEKYSEAPIEDGHQWRKYGQKVILNAKHPRNYYRCTHKFDQSCQATKQVQKIQDDPPLFKTIYYGTHTCRNLLDPEMILDYGCGSERLISFDNKLNIRTRQDLYPLFSSSSSSSVKKECKEEENQDHHLTHNHHHHLQFQSSLSHDDYLISDGLTFDSSGCCKHLSLSSTLETNHSDVISEVWCDSVELDSFEPFDF